MDVVLLFGNNVALLGGEREAPVVLEEWFDYVFRSEAGYGVVTSDEFEGDPADVISEFDPHGEE